MPAPPTADAAFARGLRLLTARDYSERELCALLTRAGHTPDDVATTLARLRRCGYVDDARVARGVAAAAARAGRGRAWVRQRLGQRGLPAPAEAAVSEALGVPASAAAHAAAAALVARRYGAPPLTCPAAYRRACGFLARRGFGADEARALLGSPPPVERPCPSS